jgi:hypothetical protein
MKNDFREYEFGFLCSPQRDRQFQVSEDATGQYQPWFNTSDCEEIFDAE